ncbi:hypothetical protein J3R30DRAFT_3315295 [Lentinula aciculospora]|uniref:Uncharacterized protein n=1 Tax=Lentinula aciculospora TaxID=153920 RepID=A0A9W8ZTC8_9AGAR|nr:hypothetical protein J3R30DRAFT_3315295 [Lentinula aciculospora]
MSLVGSLKRPGNHLIRALPQPRYNRWRGTGDMVTPSFQRHSLSRRSKSWLTKFLGQGPKKACTHKIPELSKSLIGWNLMNIFVDNCEKVVADWEFLLRKVTVPSDVTSSHPGVVAAFQMLDGIMSGGPRTFYEGWPLWNSSGCLTPLKV